MSKRGKKLDNGQAAFRFLPSFNPAGLKLAVKAAVKASGLSVDQIADKMSEFLGRTVSKDTVYAYTTPSKGANWPGTPELAALIYATGQPQPLDALGAVAGLSVIDQHDRELLEIARLQEQRAAIDERLAALSSLRRRNGGAQ